MDMQQLIERKRQEIAKLQAQVDVLEELAAETGLRTGRRGRPRGSGRPRGAPAAGRIGNGRRRGRRAGRGANQERVLGVLTATPMRAKDIAAAAELSSASANQVLMGLKKSGMAEQTGRGLYKRAGGAPTSPTSESRAPRAARSPRAKASRKPRRSLQPVREPEAVHPEEVSEHAIVQQVLPT